jgi:hypothetical protein
MKQKRPFPLFPEEDMIIDLFDTSLYEQFKCKCDTEPEGICDRCGNTASSLHRPRS